MTMRSVRAVWAALAWTAGALAMAEPGPVSPALTGELTRVDLTRRSIFVKTEGREPRELEAVAAADTRIVSRGRPWRFEDLRPGDRVVVVAAGEQGGRRLARVIKVVGRAAIPSPSTSPPQSTPFD
jgi:hypothetical protein